MPLLLRREPRLYWASVAVVVAIVFAWVHVEQDRAADLRRQWGETRTVVRARVDLAGGSALSPSVVEMVELPLAAVPADAVTEIPPDARIADRLSAGEIVTTVHMAAASSRGPIASQLRIDEVAIAVRADAVVPALAPGDPVVVIAVPDSLSGAEPLVAAGRTVGVDDDRVTIAVDAGAASILALAAQSGRLTIAASGANRGLTATSSTTR
ncbi:MAG: hypothetical protein AB7V43_21190 [Acidimicrobiia bacterium]